MKEKSIESKNSKKQNSTIVKTSNIYNQLDKSSNDNWPSRLSPSILSAIKKASASLPDLTKCTNAELDILIFAYEGIIKTIQTFKK